MIVEKTYSKWVCGTLLITDSGLVYTSKQKKLAKMVMVGGSYGYYVNGYFRTKHWININCVKCEIMIKSEVIVPF